MRRFFGVKLTYIFIFFALIFSLYSTQTVAKAVPMLDGGSRVEEVANEENAMKRRVYLGGEIIGFSLNLDGVLVNSIEFVDTIAGQSKLKSGLCVGDIIKTVDGIDVESADDIVRAINGGKEEYEIEIVRGNKVKKETVVPLIDRISGENRLGISVREDLGGIGTLTYITQEGDFGALGHCVGVGDGKAEIEGGGVYESNILGIKKGERGSAGSIKGTLDKSKRLGTVDKNTKYGIFGKIDGGDVLYDVAKRNEVTCGKAKICSCISGDREFYDIEIVKAVHQNSDNEKGLVIKVTDKRLLALTGGIVQGMSGSPIVQNNKLVGAVTHVFVNDPTRGYGLYLDCMSKYQ